jgi:hypothetical protein
MGDDCCNMLASTNYEPFESAARFTNRWRFLASARLRFVGLPFRPNYERRATMARGEKGRDRMGGQAKGKKRGGVCPVELSASSKVHESSREIGCMAVLIRGLK